MEVDENINKRSLKDINSVLEFAKLEREDVKPTTQSIYFSDHLDNDCIKLLELDKAVLGALEEGQKVLIRGDKEDSAVLCTNKQTYDIKQGEISNAMLIIPDLKFGPELETSGEPHVSYKQVGSVMHKFYELRPCKPRLSRLKQLLEENAYSGEVCEEDEDHQGKKYTMTDILDLVQGSEEEITESLQKLQAICIRGYWRVLDFDFLVQVMTHFLQLCDENDWYNSGIPIEECVTVLQELFPKDIIEHVVKCYTDKVDGKTGGEDDDDDDDERAMQIDIDYYRLNEDKVCRFFAMQILKHARKFNFKQFLSTWEKSVPEGMKTNIFQLEGMALIDRDCSPEVISYLPVDSLPEDMAERFTELFKIREKWTKEEISPYVKDLQTDKMDVNAMLTKFARASTSNGKKLYNSRKTVT